MPDGCFLGEVSNYSREQRLKIGLGELMDDMDVYHRAEEHPDKVWSWSR